MTLAEVYNSPSLDRIAGAPVKKKSGIKGALPSIRLKKKGRVTSSGVWVELEAVCCFVLQA